MDSSKTNLRTTILKWVVLSALLAYAVLITFWAHGEAARNTCVGIDVRITGVPGADSITRRGVLDELNRYPAKIIGAQINTINTREICRFLSGFNNFESVECLVTPSGELRVNIVPMIPEIRVFTSTESYYVNKDGKRIDSNAEFFVDVPVVKGNFNSRFTPKEVLPITRFIAGDDVMRNLVGMVDAHDAHNIFLVPRIHGHVINFGDTTRLEQKRDMLITMYRKVIPYKGWEEYDTISVKFRGQIVATRRDKTPRVHGTEETEDIDLEEATLPDSQETEEPVLASRAHNINT